MVNIAPMCRDAAELRLGKTAARFDARTLRLATYTRKSKVVAPANVTWLAKYLTSPMYLNDQIGCCTFASFAHLFGTWTAYATGTPLVFPDAAILTGYIAVTGQEGAAFNPKTGANDNGCNMLDVLNYVKKTGLGGHKILAYMSIDPKNHNEVMLGMNWFGGIYTGVALPVTAQNLSRPWRRNPGALVGNNAPGSWGGHAIEVASASHNGLTCKTWDQLQSMDWAFWDAYVDEAYAVLSLDWLCNSKAPNGLDLAQLQVDLAALPAN